MKIPKRINPDRIRDSIVEVMYISKVPFELVVGMFFQVLGDSYAYTNRPIEKKTIQSQIPSIGNEITIRLGSHNLFYNKHIKIQIQPNSIVFNCVKDYISWAKYCPEIENVIKQLLKSEVIECFTRVGVRYISDYEEIKLTDCVNFNFTFGMPDVKSNQYEFNAEFFSDDIKVVINLGNNIPRRSRQTNRFIPVSSIDIDAILKPPKTNNLEGIMDSIKRAHDKEKEVFFSLLKPEFLKTLNPEY